MSALTATAKRRSFFGALDQVFSSLSNGLILLGIAVVSTAEDFGLISMLLMLLTAGVGCMRGSLGTPLLLKAADGIDQIRRDGSYAATAALAVCPLLVGGMWLLLKGRELGTPTILVAIATPLVMVQDVLRYVVISEGRPHVAAIWDGFWFLGSVGLLVSTWAGAQFVDANVLIAGWTVLAAAALLGLAINLRLLPRFGGFFRWLATGWQHRLRYGIHAGLEQGGLFLALALVTVFVDPEATAALRGAMALLAPLAILTSALPLVVIPESARRSATPHQVWHGLTKVAVVASATAVTAGIVVSLLPDNIGRLLLGDTFALTQQVILIIALQYAIGMWAASQGVYLKTFNRSAAVLTLKVSYVLVGGGFFVGGGMLFHSATGAAAGIAIASTLTTAVSLAWFTPWRGRETGGENAGEDSAVVASEATQIRPWFGSTP
jgi:hypothetical protein